MTDQIDLRPAARRMATLVRNVGDDQLPWATPCTDMTVGDLLDHVGGFAVAFAGRRRARRNSTRRRATRAPTHRNSATTGVSASREPSTTSPRRGSARTRGPGRPRPDRWRCPPPKRASSLSTSSSSMAGTSPGRAVRTTTRRASLGGFVDWFGPSSRVPDRTRSAKGCSARKLTSPEAAPKFDRLLGMAGRDPHWSPPTA